MSSGGEFKGGSGFMGDGGGGSLKGVVGCGGGGAWVKGEVGLELGWGT